MSYLAPDEYQRRPKTDAIVVHCSQTPASMDVGVAEIRAWHVKERHWRDIGYHYVIRRDGTVEMGRPTWAVGAHVEGENLHTVGVCLVGGGDGEGGWEDNFTPEQWQSLERTVASLMRRYGTGVAVKGHRDYPTPKQCPSFDVGAWWKRRGKAVLALVAA